MKDLIPGTKPSHTVKLGASDSPMVAPQHRAPPQDRPFPSRPIVREGATHAVTQLQFRSVGPVLIGRSQERVQGVPPPFGP
eukprot:540871-Pyramimonas_sp.AAC.1